MIFVCYGQVYVGCKEYWMCARRMQNRMGLFSTAVKLFVWRLRLKVRSYSMPIQISGDCIGYWALRWQRHSETTAISILCSKQAAASFSRCSNAVKNVFFRSFCTPMYASQFWCNISKSCMQGLRVAYNFGCRAPYNLPWRASVSTHQVQCNIPTFEALLPKYTYLFLERCRKSNNVCLRALLQSDCLHSSLFFEHYNRILLCEWVIELSCIRLIDGVSYHNSFAFYLDSTNLGIGALLRSSFVTSVTC